MRSREEVIVGVPEVLLDEVVIDVLRRELGSYALEAHGFELQHHERPGRVLRERLIDAMPISHLEPCVPRRGALRSASWRRSFPWLRPCSRECKAECKACARSPRAETANGVGGEGSRMRWRRVRRGATERRGRFVGEGRGSGADLRCFCCTACDCEAHAMQIATGSPTRPLPEREELFARVFVPVDDTTASHRAVGAALELKRAFGSRVCVFQLAEEGGADEFLGGLGDPRTRGSSSTIARGRLHRFIGQHRARVCRLRPGVGHASSSKPMEEHPGRGVSLGRFTARRGHDVRGRLPVHPRPRSSSTGFDTPNAARSGGPARRALSEPSSMPARSALRRGDASRDGRISRVGTERSSAARGPSRIQRSLRSCARASRASPSMRSSICFSGTAIDLGTSARQP